MVLINGARYSIVVDFNKKELYRTNESAKKIIELGEEGYRITEAATILGSDSMDLLKGIGDLVSKGFIQLSSEPKPKRKRDRPHQGLDFTWLEVTSGCNLHCIHCYADSGIQQVSNPSADEIFNWIDQIAALGCKKIQFTGGECTIREDLDELILYAIRREFEFIEVFTNGTLLTESLVRFFSRNGIKVAISLYSSQPSTHDSITGIPGSSAKTIAGLKLLLAYNVPVRSAVIVMAGNENDIDGTCHFLETLGVPKELSLIRPTGRGGDKITWPGKFWLQSVRSKPDFFVNREAFDHNLFWNDCWSGKITITSEGEVLPCVYARNQVAGNIRNRPLSEIIEKGMQRFWNLTKDNVETCKDCEYRYFCHDCRPWAYGCTGNLYAKSPRCTYDPCTGVWGQGMNVVCPDNELRYLSTRE